MDHPDALTFGRFGEPDFEPAREEDRLSVLVGSQDVAHLVSQAVECAEADRLVRPLGPTHQPDALAGRGDYFEPALDLTTGLLWANLSSRADVSTRLRP